MQVQAMRRSFADKCSFAAIWIRATAIGRITWTPKLGLMRWTWGTSKKKKASVSVMLVTDIPPSTNYSGGLFIKEILESIDFAVSDAFVLLNRRLTPQIPKAARHRLRMQTTTKPIERYRPGVNPKHTLTWIREREMLNVREIEGRIVPALLQFAERSGQSAFWILLEGQSMIRLAHALMAATPLPVYVQIFDPPASWLRAHKLDPESVREVLDKFDEVLGRACSCAATSWSMAEVYRNRYGVRAVPVVPSLPASIACPPAQGPNETGVTKIGFAGQIYARREWDTLLACLDSLQWRVGNREVEIHAFAQRVPDTLPRHAQRIQFHPWQTTPELVSALSRCDLTYCAYWFDEAFREDATLCFPSKVSTYLATGRPIFFHGPAYSSPSRFLTEWKAAFVCNSPDPAEVATVLHSALTDRALYASVAQNGRHAFDQCLTHDRLANSIRDFLGDDMLSQMGAGRS